MNIRHIAHLMTLSPAEAQYLQDREVWQLRCKTIGASPESIAQYCASVEVLAPILRSEYFQIATRMLLRGYAMPTDVEQAHRWQILELLGAA